MICVHKGQRESKVIILSISTHTFKFIHKATRSLKGRGVGVRVIIAGRSFGGRHFQVKCSD